ncbi:non-specific lipid transfer protein GPI-anchored 10-like isoform X2 [Mangifera indica]|uniref:non-specific lipid transfer protein GPI-anchored 10-like isoform X2 n=1 Tax=Mangifera indica TaxID=29780 RepID=UPI001CF9EC75|nr:non-specific lipid transfer protein GPI-anchored 10-like isoform X2 [Mangifera indica]
MASVQSFPTIATTSMVILLLALPPTALSQGPATPTPPTIANCVSRMLPLSPCAPFVQGTTASPAQMCCINLKQVYSQQPDCLCLLLNSTTLSNMPINSTLALRLPALCGLQANGSACSGVPVPAGSQVSFGSNANSTVAASPMSGPEAPRPSMTRLGFSGSTGKKLKAEGEMVVVASVLVFLIAICGV